MTTHPTLSITVGEVNVLGVGRVKMDRGTLWCVIGEFIPEKCVEFFRALNDSGLNVTKLNVQDLTDKTAQHFAVGLAESQLVQALKLEHCNISSTGALSMFTSLEHNTSLEELDLSRNRHLASGDSEAVGCVGEIHVLGVGRVTLDRRTATVSLLYNAGDKISENCVEFIRTINLSGMVSKLNV